MFLACIGLSTAAVGGLFVWLLAASYLNAKAMRTWPEVPCTILLSSIEERQHDPHSPREYSHKVLFGYETGGESYTSGLLTLRGSQWSTKRDTAASSLEKYPEGARLTCRVSPTTPHTAVLKPDSLAPGYTLWFPSLFVIGGLVMAIRALLAEPRSCKDPRTIP